MTEQVTFTHDPIVAPPLAMPSREIGACVEFLGIVREVEGDSTLTGLHYEAYESMARKQFTKVFAELADQYPIAAVTLIHRLGWVPVGEASLFIRVLSKHRAEALQFCHRAIDRMKEDVPIWKVTGTPR
jgi:molybdopterin synthase catalytic subunit